MSISFDFGSEPASSCTDPWSGQATGAVAGYRTFWTTPQVPSGNPNEARALVIAAVSSTIPQQLAAGSEYYCFKLTVSSAKTVGTGACDGCSTPMCITLSEINAVQSDGNHEELTQPETANVVTWHSASGCPGANAAQNVTWGQIRSLLK